MADLSDNFVSLPEWVAWFNKENKALAIQLARAGQTLGSAVVSHAFPAGSDILNLADSNDLSDSTVGGEFIALIGVWEYDPITFRSRRLKAMSYVDGLAYMSFVERNTVVGINPASPSTVTGKSQYYMLIDSPNNQTIETASAMDNIFIRLTPRDPGGNYVALVMRAPYTLKVTDNFSQVLYSYSMGVEDRVVAGMAKRALIKEESDTSGVDVLIAQADQRIADYMWSRQWAEAPKVRNSDAVERGWGWGPWGNSFELGNPDSWLWR